MSKVTILETTLRDGSYTNNFSFSFKNTQEICKKLEDVGFEFIEIGHGLGMNASNSGYGKAKETDENYMIAADQILSKSNITLSYFRFTLTTLNSLFYSNSS